MESESGLRFKLDIEHDDSKRCDHRDVERFWECMMPVGHDSPHMPLAKEIKVTVGPMIVRSLSRG